MSISLSPKERARLYKLAEERIDDPVEAILKRAESYSEISQLIKSSLHLKTESDDIDLETLVQAMLITIQEADARIKQQQQGMAMLDNQLRKLVKVCEQNGMHLELPENLRQWMQQK